MSARKFKFVSPGIFIKEIDESQIPQEAPAIGPVIIGRTEKGPAMRPERVRSFDEFTRKFGYPTPGCQGEDIWRNGASSLAPTYAAYAAQAYLTADIDVPVNVVRLLGIKHPEALDAGEAGWQSNQAWGMFTYRWDHATASNNISPDLRLAAVFYGDSNLTASVVGKQAHSAATNALLTASQIGVQSDASGKFKLKFSNGTTTTSAYTVSFNTSDTDYIRNVLNTNPVLNNDRISSPRSGSLEQAYWLAHSFEDTALLHSSGASEKLCAITIPLQTTTASGTKSHMGDFNEQARAARSGWIFSQDMGVSGSFNPLSADTAPQKLFRAISLHDGEDIPRRYKISIEDIRIPDANEVNPYGTFTLVVRKTQDSDANKNGVLESYPNCNLNPNSSDYVARRVGDAYHLWDNYEQRYKHYGNYRNISDYIRVEMNQEVDSGMAEPSLAPFGFLGPIKPINFTGSVGSAINTKWINFSVPAKATATLMPDSGTLVVDTTLVLTNADGTDHTITVKALGGGSNSTATQLNTDKVGNANNAATELKVCLDAAVAAGTLKMTCSAIANNAGGDPRTITLTQNVVGAPGNQAIAGTLVTGNKVLVNQNTAGGAQGALAFSGGTGALQTPAQTAPIQASSDVQFVWPSVRVVATGSVEQLEQTYFGFTPNDLTATGEIVGARTLNDAYKDYVRMLPKDLLDGDGILASGDAEKEYSWAFSLDDVILTSSINGLPSLGGVTPTSVYYASGSRAQYTPDNASYTARTSARDLLRMGVNQFTLPLAGGFDGTNIKEADPFNNESLGDSTSTSKNNYAWASVERAILAVRDPEVVETNVMVAPGITNEALTNKLVSVAESRGDSLAIIDLPDLYIPPHEHKKSSHQDRLGTTARQAAKTLKERGLSSSYGCTYYPWIKVADTLSDSQVWMPPSVIALGVFGYTEERDEIWFAPAGFNRGGLNEGNAGLPVLNVTEHLSSKERDVLYDAQINPIAKFPSEGLVVFGQKTLQQTRSALDRINVRRLLIYVKKEVSRMAATLLFDQNVQATWNRFLGKVNPFLNKVKSRLGLSDFKVILDESTTTPDLIDRNVMYAKIFLKPARAIEFIAIDFVITSTGAEFDD